MRHRLGYMPTAMNPLVFEVPAHCDPKAFAVPHNVLPNLNFPQFDGSNPRLWIKSAETYFDVFTIDPFLWVKIARMNFTGSAALWLHTLPGSTDSMTWSEFTTAICYRFEKDEHNQLLRTFFHIRQTSLVSEYIE